MYLLSQYGERHEDRLPEGIFSSLEKIKEFLTVTDSFVSERLVATDYDNSAVDLILFYSSEEEFDKLSEEEKGKVEFEWYIAEQFVFITAMTIALLFRIFGILTPNWYVVINGVIAISYITWTRITDV